MRRGLRAGLLALVTVALSACGAGAPPPELYVLGDPAPATSEAVSQLDRPTVEIMRIRVPDYLDTTGIVTRHSDGRIVVRPSARWGERLSVGMTRAVAGCLEARLPQLAVTTAQPLEQPRWQLLIDIDAFEVQAGGQSVLTARWTLRDGRRGERLREEKVSLFAPVGQGSDQAVVAAMNQQVDQLVDRIALTLDRETRR
jgi:uncharacterized lipoprotein YmbA